MKQFLSRNQAKNSFKYWSQLSLCFSCFIITSLFLSMEISLISKLYANESEEGNQSILGSGEVDGAGGAGGGEVGAGPGGAVQNFPPATSGSVPSATLKPTTPSAKVSSKESSTAAPTASPAISGEESFGLKSDDDAEKKLKISEKSSDKKISESGEDNDFKSLENNEKEKDKGGNSGSEVASENGKEKEKEKVSEEENANENGVENSSNEEIASGVTPSEMKEKSKKGNIKESALDSGDNEDGEDIVSSDETSKISDIGKEKEKKVNIYGKKSKQNSKNKLSEKKENKKKSDVNKKKDLIISEQSLQNKKLMEIKDDDVFIEERNTITGVFDKTYNISKDVSRFNLNFEGSANLQKPTSLLSFDLMYSYNLDIFWLETFANMTKAKFNKIISVPSKPSLNSFAENNQKREGEEKETLYQLGLGLGYRFLFPKDLNVLNFSNLFQTISTYLTYNSIDEVVTKNSYTGFGFRADYGIHRRINSYAHLGLRFTYNYGNISRAEKVKLENSDDRRLYLSWLSFGLDLAAYY